MITKTTWCHLPKLPNETMSLPTPASPTQPSAAAELQAGLLAAHAAIAPKFLYDALGSKLFEAICELPEYYPTRTEASILKAHGTEMVDTISEGELLVEFGSGSSLKTEILLDRITASVAYVPIDVSEAALIDAEARLADRYPTLDVRPIIADFSRPVALPDDLATRRKTGFFPGSTIGNLSPKDAQGLLAVFGQALGEDGRLIIGVDLKKDPRTLVSAYNDAAGVTAAFNLNLLRRINRELGANFDESQFRHEAIFDPLKGRIEMHLVSGRDQKVDVCNRVFRFKSGESIHTENSYKYTIEQFRDVARAAGWRAQRVWTDTNQQFSVHELIWPSRS
jgi:dimethylhistidine N-methyltransferase